VELSRGVVYVFILIFYQKCKNKRDQVALNFPASSDKFIIDFTFSLNLVAQFNLLYFKISNQFLNITSLILFGGVNEENFHYFYRVFRETFFNLFLKLFMERQVKLIPGLPMNLIFNQN
jgi:hypothetical protein